MAGPDAEMRNLHERLGRLAPPVDVHALPTHGFVVAYRIGLDAGARLLPPGLRLCEVPGSGRGMLCLCGGEFRGARVGKLSIPAPSHLDYHCRVIVEHELEGETVRAGHTLHYEASSRIVELCAGNLAELRHPPAKFESVVDDERWSVRCTSKEPLCCMSFETRPHSTSWTAPETTAFGSLRAASEFLLELAGHTVHDFARERTSFTAREVREHEAAFCTDSDFDFPILEHLDATFGLDAQFDCALFVGAKRPARVRAEEPSGHVAADGEPSQLPAGAG